MLYKSYFPIIKAENRKRKWNRTFFSDSTPKFPVWSLERTIFLFPPSFRLMWGPIPPPLPFPVLV